MDHPRRKLFAAAVTAALATGLFSGPANAQDSPEPRRCDGKVVTIVGTPRNERIVGTPGNDIIAGLQGNDVIFGLGGDDTICAGQGDDIVFGGEGFDVIFGAQGNDRIYAATGIGDNLTNDVRGSRIFGGAGDDEIFGSDRWDRIQGGLGDDLIFGHEGRDWIRSGPGADAVDGGPGIDDIRTAAGDDNIDVGWHDVIRGGVGIDTCNIQGAFDSLWSCTRRTSTNGFDEDAVNPTGYRTIPAPASDPPVVEKVVTTFAVDGASVTVATSLDELPELATVVEFNGLFIDNGRGGPEACAGGTLDSKPVQCGGVVVDGLEFDPSWTTYYPQVQMGFRAVQFTWPPIEGRVTMISERPYETQLTDAPPEVLFPLPPECADIDAFVPFGVLRTWGDDNPDLYGGLLATDKGRVPTLRALGDLDAVRAELRTPDAEACVIAADFTFGSLERSQEALRELFLTPYLLQYSGIGDNRLSIGLTVADRSAIAAAIAVIEDPASAEISSALTIIE